MSKCMCTIRHLRVESEDSSGNETWFMDIVGTVASTVTSLPDVSGATIKGYKEVLRKGEKGA